MECGKDTAILKQLTSKPNNTRMVSGNCANTNSTTNKSLNIEVQQPQIKAI